MHMRVLQVIPSVGAVRGGPSQAVLELVSALLPLGVDTEIVSTDDNGPGVLNVPHGRFLDYAGVPVRFFPRFSPLLRPLREFAFSASLTRWLQANVRNYDIVHVHALFSYPSSAAMLITRRRQVPYICRPSGLLCHWSLQQSPARKRAFLALVDRSNLNGASAVEFTSEQEQSEASALKLKAATFVLPYGLHPPAIIPTAREQVCARLQIPKGDFVILFMSRLHPKKGAHYLLEGLKSLAPAPIHVIIAGTGEVEYNAQLEMLAGRSWLRERVHFVGFAEGQWKQMLLQAADLFILPSQSESFAIAVLEALGAGTPVITTPTVPLATLIRKFDLGWLCEPTSASVGAAVRNAITLLRPSSRDPGCRASARELVARNFDWPVIGQRMTEVYRAILDREALPSWRIEAITE
jgi:glycosyltransferase involved in cell wall biosynthesis